MNNLNHSELKKLLMDDKRVLSLNNHAFLEDPTLAVKRTSEKLADMLASWFLSAKEQFGIDKASANLEKYLSNDTIPVLNVRWILGIQVDDIITLENGIKIIPIEKMPLSLERDAYLHHNRHYIPGYFIQMPKVAVVYQFDNIKSMKNLTPEIYRPEEFLKCNKLLNDAISLINILGQHSCTVFYNTTYTLPEMPFGEFSTPSGQASFHQDIIGNKYTIFNNSDAIELNKLIEAFQNLNNKNENKMKMIISRLAQAKRRSNILDKILDLSIALEMALLNDNENNQQLSLSFRLRGSWLVGSDNDDKEKIYKQLKDIYTYRSQVAHSGTLCKNNNQKINNVKENFDDYVLLANKTIQALIYKQDIQWTKMLLGNI